MQTSTKDIGAGVLFIATGVFFAVSAWFGLRIGTARQMGPGFFPFMLGLLLVPLGAAILAVGLRGGPGALGRISWRGVVLVTVGIVFFSLTIRGLGFAPSLLVAVWLAAFSTEKNSPLQALVISLVFTAASVAIFSYALHLPLQVIGPWLSIG